MLAVQILALAEAEYPGQNSKALAATTLCLAHSNEMCHGKYEAAEHLAHQLIALAGPTESLHSDIR